MSPARFDFQACSFNHSDISPFIDPGALPPDPLLAHSLDSTPVESAYASLGSFREAHSLTARSLLAPSACFE